MAEDVEDVFVVETSFAQQSMWLQHQMDPTKPTCNITAAARVRGPLGTEALRRALAAVIDRHEALRTVFRVEDGVPVQVVRNRMDVPVPVVDTHPSEVEASFRQDAEKPFDVEHGPLMRMRVLRLGPEEHILLLVMHHLAMDGWSAAIMFRELSAGYRSCTDGQDAELPALPIQYADYAVWQREQLRGARLDGLLSYWTDCLDGAQPLLLPADRPRPAVRSNRGETVEFRLAAELAAALETFAREQRATLFMVLLAALKALFARYSGQRDILLATVTANRNRPEIAGLIGDFINTLVLRTDLSGDPTVAELVSRARDTCRDAYAHQELPIDMVLDALRVTREGGGIQNGLVRAMLVLQNMPAEPWQADGLLFEPMRVDTRTSILDLSLTIERARDGGYACFMEYSTELFDRATIDRFGQAYLGMLDAFVVDPAARVDAIGLPGESDWHALLAGWNATERELPRGLVHELVAGQAARTPSALALEDVRQRLTYAELDRRSDELARVLRGLPTGGRPDEPRAAVCMEPSVDLAVAVLAALKAGWAFVPLDPHLPPARLAGMVRDAAVRVVLTHDGPSRDLAEVFSGCRVIHLDQELPAPGPAARAEGPHPLGLACVLYTSGSTSEPKGVMLSHRALANFAQYVADELELTGEDRYFQLSSIGFDTFLEEMFAPLVAGAAMVLPPGRILTVGEDLSAHVRRQRITVVDLTPAYWHEWTRELAAVGGPPPSLRLAVVGGDRVLPEYVEVWRRFEVGLVEVYGLTETAVSSTVSHKTGGRARGLRPSAVLGAPLANTQVHVLDERLRPVLPGAVGEIYISGVGLANGYLHNPTMTAGRFLPDPFGAPGARMLRTGDQGRRRADAEIEFIGRLDHQVKIRGHRVEPGEVEAALAAHPEVAQAAVAVRDGAGGKQLLAYAVPVPGAAPRPELLRAFLAEALPDFLVPAAVVLVRSMPMTSSGKIDRNALAATDPARPEVSRPPANPREELLCRLMAEVVGVPEVGAEDDFFAIGGDSISAIQLASRARTSGAALVPRDVFTRRTPARLALAAETQDAAADREPAAAGPLPLTQAAAWLAASGAEPDAPGLTQAMVLRVPPGLDEKRLCAALQSLVDHHDVLRLKLTVGQEGDWQPVITPLGTVAAREWVSRADARGLTGQALRDLVVARTEAARRELDPVAGVVGRLLWFDAGEEPGRLVLLLHHLVVDGVSWRILLPDLALAHHASAEGGPVELPPVGTSLREWAHHLARAAVDPSTTGELGYWRETARTADPLLGARPLSAERDTEGASRSFTLTLPPDEAGPLLSAVPARHRAGPEEVLLTGLALALGRWRERRGCHAPAALVQLERHGREEGIMPGADLSRTVGWFTSSFPVALDPGQVAWNEGNASRQAVAAALSRVRDQLRAVPGNGIGYELLRRLNPATAPELAGPADPQIGFNYLGRLGSQAVAGAGGWELDTELTTAMGSGLDPGLPLAHALQVTSVAVNGPEGIALSATWQWAPGVLSEQDVRELARDWCSALSALAALALPPQGQG